ncbi:MAG TPA: AAA family ATPase, partial [Longimicrobiaceae bacterium]|nr:AAA family ATPase [Longimicrobiaceae bacterium]
IYELTASSQGPEIVHLQSGVDLLPATYGFVDTERGDIETYALALETIVSKLRAKYDFIFIDAQAGSDLFAQITMARSLSDQVVIVSEYDPMSAAGVERLKAIMPHDLTYDRTWYLLNKMLPEFVQSFSDFLEVARYVSPIPWDADVVRSYARRKIGLDLERGNEHTLAIIQTLRSLFPEELDDEINSWMADRAANIREPLDVQYQDTEIELQSILDEEQKNRLAKTPSTTSELLLGLLSVAVSAVVISVAFAFLYAKSPLFRTSKIDAFLIALAGASTLLTGVLLSQTLRFVRLRKQEREMRTDLDARRRRRRIDVLEERLKKLESLREANLEQLIRTGR